MKMDVNVRKVNLSTFQLIDRFSIASLHRIVVTDDF